MGIQAEIRWSFRLKTGGGAVQVELLCRWRAVQWLRQEEEEEDGCAGLQGACRWVASIAGGDQVAGRCR